MALAQDLCTPLYVLNPSHLHHHTVLCTDAIMSSKVKSECSMCVHILHARQIRNRVSTVWNQDLDSKLLSLYDTRNQDRWPWF